MLTEASKLDKLAKLQITNDFFALFHQGMVNWHHLLYRTIYGNIKEIYDSYG